VQSESRTTLAGDIFRGLDYYLELAGGGGESYVRKSYLMRNWWDYS
jgi:hypothetical protein